MSCISVFIVRVGKAGMAPEGLAALCARDNSSKGLHRIIRSDLDCWIMVDMENFTLLMSFLFLPAAPWAPFPLGQLFISNKHRRRKKERAVNRSYPAAAPLCSSQQSLVQFGCWMCQLNPIRWIINALQAAAFKWLRRGSFGGACVTSALSSKNRLQASEEWEA